MTDVSVPRSQIRHYCRICLTNAAARVPVIFNRSPLPPEFIQAQAEVDTLILNAQEAATFVSMTPAEIDAEPQHARAAARPSRPSVADSPETHRQASASIGEHSQMCSYLRSYLRVFLSQVSDNQRSGGEGS